VDALFPEEEVWIANWFRGHNRRLADIADAEIIVADYFTMDYIDSFGVIVLIEDLETTFNIRFAELDFQDRRFSTVKGLAEIVREKKRA
jgi:D-alanine--poly(phosphoribitol) ligase subunit 2